MAVAQNRTIFWSVTGFMRPDIPLAGAILTLHLLIITFNVLGLIIIPLGALAHWRLVRIPWLRLLHLALLAIVALQAVAGRACILTIWQNELTGQGTGAPPLIMGWVNRLIYWNQPFRVFMVLYVAVFAYVVALWFMVPPRSVRKSSGC
jgi:hypothetical protein